MNVQAVEQIRIDNESYFQVRSTGIPDYRVVLNLAQIARLESRLLTINLLDTEAEPDWRQDRVAAQAGDRITFGQDIGYRAGAESCLEGAGKGFWPPRSMCPRAQNHQFLLPVAPQPAVQSCRPEVGIIALALNGVPIFGGHRATASIQTASEVSSTWHSLAPVSERFDVDLCGGLAAQGIYHHHAWSECMAEAFKDDGKQHSPVYAYAADGYPIHGPWHRKDELAKSCWSLRDYSAGSPTGCKVDGERSCQLRDPLDPGKGTVSVTPGPDTNDSYRARSGVVIDAGPGLFAEDYYFDKACPGRTEAGLDRHNGHSHDDLGYHYHMTVSSLEDRTPTYPFVVGPEYRGEVPREGIASCAAVEGSPDTDEGAAPEQEPGTPTEPPVHPDFPDPPAHDLDDYVEDEDDRIPDDDQDPVAGPDPGFDHCSVLEQVTGHE